MTQERVQVMYVESVKAIRYPQTPHRRAVLLACLAATFGLLVDRESEAPPSLSNEVAADAAVSSLLAEASRFVHESVLRQGDIMRSPVSRLQCQFRLSYRGGCELAAQLETAGVWTVYLDHEDTRVARVLPLHGREAVSTDHFGGGWARQTL